MNNIKKASAIIFVAICLSSCAYFSNMSLITRATDADKRPVSVKSTPVETHDERIATQEGIDSSFTFLLEEIAKLSVDSMSENTDEIATTPAPEQNAVSKSTASTPIIFNGEWIIIKAGNHRIKQDEDMPYLNFEVKTNRFFASNGCNILNGSFKVYTDDEIVFSDVLSTSMLCPEIEYERYITDAFRDGEARHFEIQEKGNELYMNINDSSGEHLLVLRRHNMETLSGQWIVEEIGNIKIDNPEVNVFLNIDDLAIHGNTGCNFFNGLILIDPEVANSISFSQMGVTMKMCPNSEVEMAMMVALEEVTNYKLKSNNALSLLDSNGKTLLKLVR